MKIIQHGSKTRDFVGQPITCKWCQCTFRIDSDALLPILRSLQFDPMINQVTGEIKSIPYMDCPECEILVPLIPFSKDWITDTINLY
jgi:hypothetical protein